jgi:hypothetical protein
MMPTRLLAAFALLVLGACAATQPGAPQIDGAQTTPLVYHSAGPGDVMLLSDRCAAELCTAADGAALPGMTELVYLGMRSPTEAVFLRRQVAIHTGPVIETGIPGLMVPDRPETLTTEAPFIPPREQMGQLADGTEEIVVDPVAGVQFGVEHVVVNINAVTPGRLVYVVERI